MLHELAGLGVTWRHPQGNGDRWPATSHTPSSRSRARPGTRRVSPSDSDRSPDEASTASVNARRQIMATSGGLRCGCRELRHGLRAAHSRRADIRTHGWRPPQHDPGRDDQTEMMDRDCLIMHSAVRHLTGRPAPARIRGLSPPREGGLSAWTVGVTSSRAARRQSTLLVPRETVPEGEIRCSPRSRPR
jgi:hypothetical protein